MKKAMCFLLAMVMIFCVTGCRFSVVKESNALDINDFVETYKSEDIATLSENPQKFIDDLCATLNGLDTADFSEWIASDYSSEAKPWHENETVLFHFPASIDVTYSSAEGVFDRYALVSLWTDNREKDIALFNSLCEYALKKYGDATAIMHDHREISEHEWRDEYYSKGNCIFSWESRSGDYTERLDISNHNFSGYYSYVGISVKKHQENETRIAKESD